MKAFESSRQGKRRKESERSTSKTSETDWKRLDALTDEEIDVSDIPEISPEEFAKATVRKGLKPVEGKRQVTLRLDSDVLAWFKARGPGYQTRINQLLRAYMKAHENEQE